MCILQLLLLVAILAPGLGQLATNKLSLASLGSYDYREHKGPGTYAYGYNIEDPATGNIQFKHEERHPNGTVTGSYGYVDHEGKPVVTHYISDEFGYRVHMDDRFPAQQPIFTGLPDPGSIQVLPPFSSPPSSIQNPAPVFYELPNTPAFQYEDRLPLPYRYQP